MARKPAPPSATGGAGYNYADEVSAKYLLDMLAGRSAFGPMYGPIVRVDWEVRDEATGWLIDDLRLTLRSDNTDRFVAISLKRNRQVTNNGFPSDFVNDVWEMVLGKAAVDYESDRDLLALAVGQLAQNVHDAWEGLLRQAIETTADRLARRASENGSVSDLQRTLFNSLRCPETLQSQIETNVDVATAGVMPGLRLLHLDFDSEPSNALSDALALAKVVVKSGNDQDAQLLWQALVSTAASQREAGGAIDLCKLLSQPNLPALREHPDLQRDWGQLTGLCDEAAARIRTDLGTLTLLRHEVFKRVLTLATPQRVGVLLGDSGSSKSALAKRLAYCAEGPTLWLDPVLLNVASLTELQSQKLGLQTSMGRLIRELAAPHGFIVIDGIDQIAPATDVSG